MLGVYLGYRARPLAHILRIPQPAFSQEAVIYCRTPVGRKEVEEGHMNLAVLQEFRGGLKILEPIRTGSVDSVNACLPGGGAIRYRRSCYGPSRQ